MKKSNNEERLKVLRKRLDEIQNKDSSFSQIINTISSDKESENASTPTSTKKNKNKNNLLKKLLLFLFFIFGIFYLFNYVIDVKANFEFESKKNTIRSKDSIITKKEFQNDIKYSFNFGNSYSHLILTSKSYSNEDVKKTVEKFILDGYNAQSFYIPDYSNSNEQLYKIQIGPYFSLEEAEQWKSTILDETIIISL